MEYTRRSILKLGFGALVGSSVVAAAYTTFKAATGDRAQRAAAASSGSAQPLTIGFLPILCSVPLIIAHERGIYERQGLNVRLKKFSGWAEIWTAVASGELHVAQMLTPMPFALGALAGQRGPKVSMLAVTNTNGQSLVIANKHKDRVQGAADLKGMILGIPFDYSIHALLLRDYLAEGGLDPDRDVQLRVLRPPDMLASLAAGNVDGFIAPEPFNEKAVAMGSGFVLRRSSEMWENHPCCSLVAERGWTKQYPTDVEALIAAVTEASLWVDEPSNRGFAATILAEEQYLNQDEALIRSALTGSKSGEEVDAEDARKRISFEPYPEPIASLWISEQLERWSLRENDDPQQVVREIVEGSGVKSALRKLGAPMPISRSSILINGNVYKGGGS